MKNQINHLRVEKLNLSSLRFNDINHSTNDTTGVLCYRSQISGLKVSTFDLQHDLNAEAHYHFTAAAISSSIKWVLFFFSVFVELLTRI